MSFQPKVRPRITGRGGAALEMTVVVAAVALAAGALVISGAGTSVGDELVPADWPEVLFCNGLSLYKTSC